mgnify:CR=1 FL=1
MKNKKLILIVEDEAVYQKILSEKLTAEGYTVQIIADGVSALASALNEQPDLVLLDLNIPGIGGLGMVKRLREDERGKNIKVIILTNSPDIETIQTAMQEHVFEYFIKSETKIADLVLKVKNILG